MNKICVREFFRDLIEYDSFYVDKTKIIEDLLNDSSKIHLFTRPRRFGRSVMTTMLDDFFNVEKKDNNLFKDFYISKSKYYKYLSDRPVINLSFVHFDCNSYKSFYEILN